MTGFTFFYPVVVISQNAFRDDGTVYQQGVEKFQEGHIVFQGSLLCGKNMDVRLANGKKQRKTVKNTRIEGVEICGICQEKWKQRKDSAWNRWVSGIAKDASEVLTVAKIEF